MNNQAMNQAMNQPIQKPKYLQIKPTKDHVLVKIETPKNETTSSGIILNANKQKPQCIGTVEAIGPGRVLNNGELLPITVKIGDKVIFYDYVGTVMHQENDFIILLIKENDIMAIIEE